VGRPEAVHPYNLYTPGIQSRVSGGTTVKEWRRGYLYEGPTAPPPEKKASAS
jgi:hypothetical protein